MLTKSLDSAHDNLVVTWPSQLKLERQETKKELERSFLFSSPRTSAEKNVFHLTSKPLDRKNEEHLMLNRIPTAVWEQYNCRRLTGRSPGRLPHGGQLAGGWNSWPTKASSCQNKLFWRPTTLAASPKMASVERGRRKNYRFWTGNTWFISWNYKEKLNKEADASDSLTFEMFKKIKM